MQSTADKADLTRACCTICSSVKALEASATSVILDQSGSSASFLLCCPA